MFPGDMPVAWREGPGVPCPVVNISLPVAAVCRIILAELPSGSRSESVDDVFDA